MPSLECLASFRSDKERVTSFRGLTPLDFDGPRRTRTVHQRLQRRDDETETVHSCKRTDSTIETERDKDRERTLSDRNPRSGPDRSHRHPRTSSVVRGKTRVQGGVYVSPTQQSRTFRRGGPGPQKCLLCLKSRLRTKP